MFSQTTEYALRAMTCLAFRPTDLVPTPVLAEQSKVPANYLAKVLQQLAGAKLINGRRGVGGGYKLARPAGDIKLMEVINAVNSVTRVESCPHGPSGNGAGLCALHKKADEAAAAVIRVYSSVTLQDVAQDQGSAGPLCTAHEALAAAGSKR